MFQEAKAAIEYLRKKVEDSQNYADVSRKDAENSLKDADASQKEADTSRKDMDEIQKMSDAVAQKIASVMPTLMNVDDEKEGDDGIAEEEEEEDGIAASVPSTVSRLPSNQRIPEYKLIIVGADGVGKTSLVNCLPGKSKPNDVPNVGATVHPWKCFTNRGPIIFNIWDVKGWIKEEILHNGFCVQAQAAIIMFDVTCGRTYSLMQRWRRALTRVCPNIPIVHVGNKVDIEERVVEATEITAYHDSEKLQYYDISATSKYNFEKPFLWLARKLAGDNSLYFVEAPDEDDTVSLGSL